MNSHHAHFMPQGPMVSMASRAPMVPMVPTLIDLTAEGFSADDSTPGDLMLLEIVIGALLLLGVVLLGLQIGR